ncbi:aTP-dependent Clp protease proteolytic subunit [Clostridium sp. CAG:288]|jgi:ATP-dependent Clp protease, proteolytic subunit ClpP|nr:aTP-dependent Clp protease proteolytic subunit [Clostridium sp. CAG:288]HCY68353.1 ATP-dependent Clp protease proteolytic subunit [Bacillota bacterium]
MRYIPAVNVKSYDGNSSYDLYSLLLKERIIMLTGEIDDTLSEIVCSELIFLNAKDQELPISIYIDSPGGSVTAGMAIYDVMKAIEAPIKTIGLGLCASMAAFLLSSGDKGYRYAYPNAEIMIHQPIGQTQGQVSDLEIMTKRFISLKNKLNSILASNTNKSLEEIEKDTDRDNFLTADEAIEYGLIDFKIKTEKLIS